MQTTQMENSLQLCIIHIFCFVLLANASEFGVEPDDGCKEARCGDGEPTIGFPFRLMGQQPEHCGYPGFELSCTEDNQTMLELPRSGKFYVKNISYTEQWIDLYDQDGCIDPRQLRIPDLTSSPFDFWGMRNYTFFNCSTYKDSSWDRVMLIPCLSSTHHYQIAALWSDADAIHVPQSCRKMYDLEEPVPFSLKYDDHDGKYISLLWNNPMCRTCYAFGQKCTRIGNTLETRCLLNISKHKTANASEFGVEPDDGCKETRCGDDGPTIQFPFWLKDQRPKHCGYPGFELYCTEDNHTMLELPHSGKFYVKDINYTGQGITLYDLDGCINLTMVRIPDLTSSPFEFDMHNYTFFNCSTHKDSLRDDVMGRRIFCLSSTHHYQITALMTGDFHVPQSCRKMYDLEPVPFNWDYDDEKYISLRWHTPMGNISKNKTGIYYLISAIYFNVDPLELSLNLYM
ncbi:uncharacterized protein LOC126720294 [Quercus robur]|uniref:uncharacterized protein LOC126720294 n=1 Tax=Quercus robur TaxID=38942 RepID=UPI0021626B78|nr:uncharacterized protein LOC126720294 [Quercus robur]